MVHARKCSNSSFVSVPYTETLLKRKDYAAAQEQNVTLLTYFKCVGKE